MSLKRSVHKWFLNVTPLSWDFFLNTGVFYNKLWTVICTWMEVFFNSFLIGEESGNILEDEKHMSWWPCTHLASLSFSKANAFLLQPHKTTRVLWVHSYGAWLWRKMKTVGGWAFMGQPWNIRTAFDKSLDSMSRGDPQALLQGAIAVARCCGR